MITLRQINELRQLVQCWHGKGELVGVAMTMGALHAGHLSLATAAREECDRVLATLFVNPLQFGPAEDYEQYPREEERDLALLEESGCDAVFAPSVETIFPRGERFPTDSRTLVTVRGITQGLCGRSRPGHFAGVTTEVMKMMNITGADVAYFGEKDYQQYLVIRAMAEDLFLPVRVVACPTVREPDGLAMSSRNAYLTPAERARAPGLYATLCQMAAALRERGAGAAAGLVASGTGELLRLGFDAVEYLEIRDNALAEPGEDTAAAALRVFAAVRLGQARLIDNVAVEPEAAQA
jgi:pantoate--beta-alanine ligase